MRKEVLIFLNGGMSFRDEKQMIEHYENFDIDYPGHGKSWKDWLAWTLEDKYTVLQPKFRTSDNANYKVWKLFFEKYLAKVKGEKLNIVAHSLGTTFILKYLVENKLKINNLHLVASIVTNDFQPKNDPEDTATFTFDISKVKEIQKQVKNIHLWHSADYEMCTMKNPEYLYKQLPKSKFHKFKNKGHFLQPTFVELFEELYYPKR